MAEKRAVFEAVDIRPSQVERVAPQGVAFFDVALIAGMFAALSGAFVMAPGLGVNLDGGAMEIPVAARGADLEGEIVSASLSVLNIRGNSSVIFGGKIYSPENFEAEMKNYKGSGVLLVKADKDVDMQSFLKICQLAKASGFERVQIAAKPAEY